MNGFKSWALALSILAGVPSLATAHEYTRHGEHSVPALQAPELPGTMIPVLERGVASETAESARAFLREAMASTARGEKERAIALYREAVGVDANEGIPALGRFLALAGTEEERVRFSEELKAADSPHSEHLRARGLASLGDRAGAIDILLNAETADPAALLFLATLMDREDRREEATGLLAAALSSGDTNSPLVAEALVQRLGREARSMESAAVVGALDAAYEALGWGARRINAREALDAVVFSFQMEDYFLRRPELMRLTAEAGIGSALLRARLLVHEDEHDQAIAAVEEAERRFGAESTARRLLLDERLWLLRAVGRMDEARLLAAQLVEQDEGDSRSRLALDLARTAIARGDLAEAGRELDKIDRAALDRFHRRLYHAARTEVLAHYGDHEALMDYYATHSSGWIPEEREAVFAAIFRRIENRADRLALEGAIRRRMAQAEGNNPPELWLLAARAAIEGLLKSNELEARARYSEARPEDIVALEELALEATAAAIELRTLPPEMIARLPANETGRITRLAEESLRALLLARPFANNGIAAMITLYRETGREDEAGRALDFLAERADNPRVLANLAYVLAISDLAEDALPLYDRALESIPDDMNVQLNRVAAQTRVGQWDEAIALYKKLMVEGHNGREWHFHDIVERYYNSMMLIDREEEGRAFLRQIPDLVQGDWRLEATEDIAEMYVPMGHPEEAEHFYNLLLEISDDADQIARVWLSKGINWIMNGDPDRALEVFREARASGQADDQLNLEMMLAEAKVYAETNRLRESIRALLDVARLFPETDEGKSVWYLAGTLAERLDESEEAVHYYRTFLATDTTLFGVRRDVRERIRRLGGDADVEPGAGREQALTEVRP